MRTSEKTGRKGRTRRELTLLSPCCLNWEVVKHHSRGREHPSDLQPLELLMPLTWPWWLHNVTAGGHVTMMSVRTLCRDKVGSKAWNNVQHLLARPVNPPLWSLFANIPVFNRFYKPLTLLFGEMPVGRISIAVLLVCLFLTHLYYKRLNNWVQSWISVQYDNTSFCRFKVWEKTKPGKIISHWFWRSTASWYKEGSYNKDLQHSNIFREWWYQLHRMG